MAALDNTGLHTHDDQGISLPLVMGAMLVFSAMMIILAGVAHFAIKGNDIALQRNQAFAAVEAGANDFVNRLNAYSQFDEWNAAKTKPFLDKNQSTSTHFPNIVRESGFGQWIRVAPTRNEQFTYDVVRADPTGVVFRVTGRAYPQASIYRSVEYRVARKAKGSIALAVERPYANTAGYAYIHQFRALGDRQGDMAITQQGAFLSLSDYELMCDNQSQTGAKVIWKSCYRPYFNGFDKIEGDLVTGAPITVHGNGGLISTNNGVVPPIADWPTVTKSLEIVQGDTNQNAVSSKIELGSSGVKTSTYDDNLIRANGKQQFLNLVNDHGGRTSPPAQFKEIRRRAKPEQVCRFMGSTQVLLHGDDVYVRSPHTPAEFNRNSAPWCRAVAGDFYGRRRDLTRPDIMFQDAQAGRALNPTHPVTWVKLADVPTDAIFVIERIPPQLDCEHSVTGDNDGWGNYTGVGFPANRDDSDPLLGTNVGPYDCRNGDLFIDGAAARRKTFAAEDNIYLTGGIRYTDRDMNSNYLPANADDALGLVAQRNVFIYNPPSRDSRNRNDRFFRYPRSPYILPVNESELKQAESGRYRQNQGPWGSGQLNKWRAIPTYLGPSSKQPQRTQIPSDHSWLNMPIFDGVIVAETGAFLLENPLMHNRPTTISSDTRSTALSAVVTGAVFSRYAPLLHIDYQTAAGEVKMHGLHGHYINDPRLERTLPPGFTGLSVTAYRLIGFAEVGSHLHLEASHQYSP